MKDVAAHAGVALKTVSRVVNAEPGVGLASGLNLVVSNPAAHGQEEYSEQEALVRLGAYSALARLLDQCEIVAVEDS